MSFSNNMLADKRILITGAARGIGKSCALICAEQGAKVIAVDLSGPELDTLVSESTGHIEPWVGDVTSDVLAKPLDNRNGSVKVPDGHGLGVDVDESKVVKLMKETTRSERIEI